MEEIKTENWNGHEVRYVKRDGQWWAILKDVNSLLKLKTCNIVSKLDPDMIIRVPIEHEITHVKNPYKQTFNMLAVNESGLYELLFASNCDEAKKFKRFAKRQLQNIREENKVEMCDVFSKMISGIVGEK